MEDWVRKSRSSRTVFSLDMPTLSNKFVRHDSILLEYDTTPWSCAIHGVVTVGTVTGPREVPWRRYPNVAQSLEFDPEQRHKWYVVFLSVLCFNTTQINSFTSNTGTFWMSLEDFVRIFTVVEGVFYSARKLEHAKEDLSALKNRHPSAVKSQWTSDTAGGAQGPLWRVNPQFRFEWTRSKGNTSMLWISLAI